MQDRRRSKRYGVDVEGIVRSEGGIARKATISDLSVEGCRLSVSDRRFASGTTLTVGLGPIGLLHAKVVWRIGQVHGLSFNQVLHPAVLDQVRTFLSREPALIEERPAA